MFDFDYQHNSKIPKVTPVEESVVVVDIVGAIVVIIVSVGFVPAVVDPAIVRIVALSTVALSNIKIIEIHKNIFVEELIDSISNELPSLL